MAQGLETQYRIELTLNLNLRGNSVYDLDEVVKAIKRDVGHYAEVTFWKETRPRHDIPSSVAQPQPSVVTED